MNESLKYLNTVLYSGKEFVETWKSFDCDKSTNGLMKEINSRLNTIEKQIPSINEDQLLFLIENFEGLISKCSEMWKRYQQRHLYYDLQVWDTEEIMSVELINDGEAHEKYRNKKIKEYRENRDSKLIEYEKKKKAVSELIKILNDFQKKLQKKLSLEQIKIPGLTMDKGEMNTLKWQKTDTDLLELVTALFESGSITNSTKDLTRKEAINAFLQFFEMEIKDAESKLSRATSRKKDVSQYLTNLKTTFEDYAKAKDERLDSQRN